VAAPPHVGVISEIPTPYRLPLYERIASRGDLDLEVLFCAEEEPDRPWNLGASLDRVPHRVLHGWAPTIRTRKESFVYEINPSIVSVLREARYDAIVIGGYSVFAEQAAIVYARATRTPYLLHSESHHLKPRGAAVRAVKHVLLRPIVGGASAGLAVGSLAARYLESYGLDGGRIRIVPNTIDVDAFAHQAEAARADAEAIRSELGLPSAYVVFVGRLVAGKGVLELLAALERLGDDAPQLVVAGEGPLADEVAAAPNVTHLGFQPTERIIQLYALADRAVVPSRAETWGVSVNEALACGCPVVATDAVGAAHDLIEDSVNGYVVPAYDVPALAAALVAPRPAAEHDRRIRRWTYDFGAQQFAEGVGLALGDQAR
jgi:glycosyltransferase involved in cell wall biosynthesis